MKVRDLIAKMSDRTEIIIYTESKECAMPPYGDCEGGEANGYDYDCKDCSFYLEKKYESMKYHGVAMECPIKLAEYSVEEINNAYHQVQVSKKKTQERHMIAIKVREREE